MRLIAEALKDLRFTYVVANNRLDGNAPATIRVFVERWSAAAGLE